MIWYVVLYWYGSYLNVYPTSMVILVNYAECWIIVILLNYRHWGDSPTFPASDSKEALGFSLQATCARHRGPSRRWPFLQSTVAAGLSPQKKHGEHDDKLVMNAYIAAFQRFLTSPHSGAGGGFKHRNGNANSGYSYIYTLSLALYIQYIYIYSIYIFTIYIYIFICTRICI